MTTAENLLDPPSRLADASAGGKTRARATDEATFRPSPDVRAVRGGDDLILLDLRSGSYFSFTAVAAEVWDALEAGATAVRIAERLRRVYGIPAERAAADAGQLLGQLEAKGLIVRGDGAPDAGDFTPRPLDDRRAAALAAALFEVPAERRRGRWPERWLLLVQAFATLVWVDLAMRLSGLGALYRRISAQPAETAAGVAERPLEPERIWAVVHAVDRAAALYFKRVWCLQRSVTCAYLLRRRGVPARLVLGVVPVPFFAHAWVAVGGWPINEGNPRLLESLREIDRC